MRSPRRAVGALPLRRQPPPARRGGLGAPPRPRERRSGAARVRASARQPGSAPRSARTVGVRSTRATRYQLHVDGDDDALRVLAAAGDRRSPARLRSIGHRGASSHAAAVAPRISAARSSAGIARRSATRRTSSCAPRSLESAALLTRLARAERSRAGARRARDPCRRVREELGGDRVAAGADGRRRDRARARGTCRRRRDARAREPPCERRSREPRAHEPLRAASARGGRSAFAPATSSTSCRSRCERSPSSGFAIRPSRCASSPRAPIRPRRRLRCTGGFAASRSSRRHRG